MPEPGCALPTTDDPLARASSEALGGPAGRRVAGSGKWWTPVRVVLAVACVTLALGMVSNAPCRGDSWRDRGRDVWLGMCYSDAPYLFREHGLADGQWLYLEAPLEYPVLTGAVMQATGVGARAMQSVIEPGSQDPALMASGYFFDLTALLMAGAALVIVVAVARVAPRRPWDALMVAASPVLMLTATINWDLMAAALAVLAILAWTRERPGVAGVMIGLGTAAKLFPVLLLGPLLVVAMRPRVGFEERNAGLRSYGIVVLSAAVTWIVVNLPVYLIAPEGWRYFWRFNEERGAEFGSPWYALDLLGHGVSADRLDELIFWILAGAGLAILLLGMLAPQPPRLAQLCLLTVAVFVLVNKVWSPQYALWLLPLAVLARPRWRDLMVWQAGEVAYFVAIWLHLASLTEPDRAVLSYEGYAGFVVLRVAGLLWLMGVVIRDVLRSKHDPVRPYVQEAVEPAR